MNIVVFGGSGFIGRCLVARLVEMGHYVIVPTRNRERTKNQLIVLPNTDLVGCDPTAQRSIDKLIERADVVINLIGIIHQTAKASFEKTHVDFCGKLSASLARSQLRQLIHVSALNAKPGAPSKYLRSKGKAEGLIAKSAQPHTIIRPSLVFGDGSDFLRMMEWQINNLPILAIPFAKAKFQPIWINDFVQIILGCLLSSPQYDKTLTVGGPDVLTLAEIYKQFQVALGVKQLTLPLGQTSARAIAGLLDLIPFVPPLLTSDNIASMTLPNVCESGNDAKQFVSELTSLPEYLLARTKHFTNSKIKELNRFRHSARRS